MEVEEEVDPEVVMWLSKGAQGGTRVEMEGGIVAAETFTSPGSSLVEMLLSRLLIQHQGVTAPGS